MKRDILRHIAASWLYLGLAGAFCASSVASAQWLPDRAYREGPGIKLGERFELHPGVAVRGGYDSNVYHQEPGNERASGLLAVTPHLNISTIGEQRRKEGEGTATNVPPKLILNSGASVSYIHYFEEAPPRGLEVDVANALQLFPEGVVNASFFANYERSIRPFTQGPASQIFRRDTIAPGAALGFQSKGGVLSGSVGFKPRVLIFEKGDADDQNFAYLNTVDYRIPVKAAWKFLPHTALLWDSDVTLRDYLDPTGTNVAVANSATYHSELGINGALTNELALRVVGGVAVGFYDSAILDEYQEVIGEAMLSYFLGRRSFISAGYQRDVNQSYTGAWQQYDRGRIEASFILARAVSLSAEVDVGKYVFGRVVGPMGNALGVGGADSREDLRYNAGVHAEYRVTNYLAFMADFSAQIVDTDFEFDPAVMGAIADPAEFNVYLVSGGVRAFY